MRAILIIFVSIVLLSNMYGQSYSMKVNLKNKSSILIPVGDITKITFSNFNSVKGGDLEKLNLVKSFLLLQNYPNPFNPSTTISYQIPKSGNVEIKIFNLEGKCIKTLFNGMQAEGTQNISWDSRDEDTKLVASNVYLYQIKFDNQIISKKMLLIK